MYIDGVSQATGSRPTIQIITVPIRWILLEHRRGSVRRDPVYLANFNTECHMNVFYSYLFILTSG